VLPVRYRLKFICCLKAVRSLKGFGAWHLVWRAIRAVRRVVKQLPVEMLQGCSSASSCMRKRIVMEGHLASYSIRVCCPSRYSV
jgi:hypothetical protein